MFELLMDLLFPALIIICGIKAYKKQASAAKVTDRKAFHLPVDNHTNQSVDAMAHRTIGASSNGGFSNQPMPTQNNSYNGSYSQAYDMTRWKEQLDGFLKSGLIDRAEYQVLLDRRKQCFHDEGHH